MQAQVPDLGQALYSDFGDARDKWRLVACKVGREKVRDSSVKCSIIGSNKDRILATREKNGIMNEVHRLTIESRTNYQLLFAQG